VRRPSTTATLAVRLFAGPVGAGEGSRAGPKGFAEPLERYGGAVPQMRVATPHKGQLGSLYHRRPGAAPASAARVSGTDMRRRMPTLSCPMARFPLATYYYLLEMTIFWGWNLPFLLGKRFLAFMR
jgi:hypothetical protein